MLVRALLSSTVRRDVGSSREGTTVRRRIRYSASRLAGGAPPFYPTMFAPRLVFPNWFFRTGFSELAEFFLGDTGVPYEWKYGDRAGKS
jgi:hypothetical protein